MRLTRIGAAAFIAALAIVLALSLGLWSHWTASAQDTFIVNDDTTPRRGGCDTPDFQTEDIEDAIDSGLVADGDTLMICEGTYNPPSAIEVNKELDHRGTGRRRPGRHRHSGNRRQRWLCDLGGRGHYPPPEADGRRC